MYTNIENYQDLFKKKFGEYLFVGLAYLHLKKKKKKKPTGSCPYNRVFSLRNLKEEKHTSLSIWASQIDLYKCVAETIILSEKTF